MPPSTDPKRVIVAFPSVNSVAEWASILTVRDRYDPLAPKIAPHLTLVSPFQDPLSDAALHAHVRATVSGIASFPVTLAEITGHEDEYLFLNVKCGNDQLVRLRDTLYSETLATHRSRRHTFVPHITVGRLPLGDLPAALDETSSITSQIRAHIHTVAVYRIEPDGSRPVIFRVPLRTADAV